VGTDFRGNGDGMWSECIVVFVGKEVIRGRGEQIYMILFRLTNGVVMENLGIMGGRYFPFVLGLFVFILIMNVAGYHACNQDS